MKSFARILQALLLLLPLAAPCRAESDRDTGAKSFSRTVSLQALHRDGQTIYVGETDGGITIKAIEGMKEIQIRARKTVRAESLAAARELVDAVDVEVYASDRLVRLRTVRPTDREGIAGRIDYTLLVPPGTPVVAHTASGAVTVSGPLGDTRLRTVSGDIEASGVSGTLRAETVSGNVYAEDCPKTVYLASAFRPVSLFTTELTAQRLEIFSFTGSVTAALPHHPAATLYVSSLTGNLKTVDYSEWPRTPPQMPFLFTFGAGSSRVLIETLSGDITIGRVEP